MPRKTIKEPEEGACPRCRKLIALTPKRGGELVLRTHHVVVAEEHYSGHGVVECEGSGSAPAADIDDSKDWAWIGRAPAKPFADGGLPGTTPLGQAIREVTDQIRGANQQASGAIGEAIGRLSGSMQIHREEFAAARDQIADAPDVPRDMITPAPSTSMGDRRRAARSAARRLREALTPVFAEYVAEPQILSVTPSPDGYDCVILQGRAEPAGIQFRHRVSYGLLTDTVAMNIMIDRAVAETRRQLERRFRPSQLTPTSVELNGVDITGMITGPVEITYEPESVTLPDVDLAEAVRSVEVPETPDFLATVLVAIRQAYVDETGEPPTDAHVSLSAPDQPDMFIRDMQVMRIVLEPRRLRVDIPIYGNAPDIPGFAAGVARDAAATVRQKLRRRPLCNERALPHACGELAGEEPHTHRCRLGWCGFEW
ncbi:hypothetical protein ACIP79_00545 [Streptomyces sp. NPDC088747]|uniref:hypothetical protein n=1 Tax=Streptomyces sp. NPDC088747 TaxID=3365886 RepID=UPI00382C2045